MYAPTHMHTYTCTDIHTHIHTYTHIHIYVRTYTYAHIHTYIHTYTYTHLHTYTHMYTQPHTLNIFIILIFFTNQVKWLKEVVLDSVCKIRMFCDLF